MTNPFSNDAILCGELRHPRQMLDDQTYDGHQSIHDDSIAEDLGFTGAPIEGPTHFSQFVPLLYEIFGQAWFETGCISAHYQNMVVEGEAVRAFAKRPVGGTTITQIWAEKRDGTPVMMGTASIGPDHGETEIDRRMAKLKPSNQLVIMSELKVGQKGAGNPEPVSLDFDTPLGDLYPFSLNQKLSKITESCEWYTEEGGKSSPWGRAAIRIEMISCLTQYTSRMSGFAQRGPAIGLFAGQQIKLIKGPLIVGHPYLLEREIIALSESRRTESCWTKTSIFDGETKELVGEAILNGATLKDSYAKYEEDAKMLGKALAS